MATLQDCLRQLPEDMLMMARAAAGRKTATVSQLLEKYQKIQDGYKVRDDKYDYSRTILQNGRRHWRICHFPAEGVGVFPANTGIRPPQNKT